MVPPLLDDSDPALFPKLSDEQLALLTPIGELRAIEVDDVLFREGDPEVDPIVVIEGEVIVVQGEGDTRREIVVQLPRDLMAELTVFTGQRIDATAIVTKPGSVLVVPLEDFRALVGRELEFGDFVLQSLFRRRRAVSQLGLGIRIVGSQSHPDTMRLREFASRNRLLSAWIDPDDPVAASMRGLAVSDARSSPMVDVGGGNWISNPTNAELASAVGLRTGVTVLHDSYDLAVVGAGPAGLAAAVYGASGGMVTALIDAVAVGGQAATSAKIENYLGFPAGLSGAELAERAELQAQKFGADILVPCRAVSLMDRDDGAYRVGLEDGTELVARAVILAIGVQYRRLPIPNITAFEGRGVAYATDSARQQLGPGDPAVVVGGANSAGQTASSLAEDGRNVDLVVRDNGLERSMARYLRDRIAADPRVEVHLQHQVRGLDGDAHLERVTIESVVTGQTQVLAARAMAVLVGAAPRTEWLTGEVELDEAGFVLTGAALEAGAARRDVGRSAGRDPFPLETSKPGVFAVGDVRSGATRMVAPAVGEGGMAVRLAAEHLARQR